MASVVPPSALAFKRKTLIKSATTARRCLLVYPAGKKAKQRVAVGDTTGLFRVFSIGKRLEPVLAFETLETVATANTGSSSGGGATPAAINAGAGGSVDKDRRSVTAAALYADQLFFVQGSVLHAYSRKGKPFFTVDTNVTERVSALAIETPFIFLAGDFMVTTMEETKELGFYLSPDRVNDMCVFVHPASTASDGERQLGDYVCCLACNDRVLRLVQANKLVDEVSCEATLTTLVLHPALKLLFYGTQSGSIGVMALKDNGSLRRVGGFMPTSAGGSSSVTSFGLADVNADGHDELIVGYDDGAVQVLCLELTTAARALVESVALLPLWSGSVGERVTSVAGGCITTGIAGQPDVLVHTFSGQVVAFTLDTDAGKEDVQAAAAEAAERQAALLAKQQDTQGEIEQLKALIARRTQELSAPPPPAAVERAQEAAPVVALSPTFTLTVTLTPLERAPMLSLVVFADVPLEAVMLRCSAALTFVSTDTAVVKSRPLFSTSAAAGGAVATITPAQLGSRRLEIHLWADEGVADTLQVTAYSGQMPRTAQVKYTPLYALPLYERVSTESAATAIAPAMLQAMSRWIIRGNFGRQDVLAWMAQLLPDLADLPHGAAVHRHFFVSSFLQSTLVVEVDDAEDGLGAAGEGTGGAEDFSRVIFSCNSLVTLATVKRHVSQSCAQRGMTITTREHVLYQTAHRQLQLLYPLMASLSNSQRRLRLLQGLRELQGAENDLSFLPHHMQEVLASAEEVELEAEAEAQQEAHLRRAVAAVYKSLVYFKSHAPPLSDATRLKLEAAACGLGFDTAVLERLFFPRKEQAEEAAAMAASGGGGPAYPTLATVAAPARGEGAAFVVPAAREVSEAPSEVVSSLSGGETPEL